MKAIETIKWAIEEYGIDNIALSSSLSIEDQVLTDMLLSIDKGARIFTLDTGRLPRETYDVISETNKKYGINIEILFPEKEEVESMVNKYGPNLFYDSLEKRKMCCNVRKLIPLRKRLKTLKAWITGLRRDQSITRDNMERVEEDKTFGLIKINPLIEWSEKDVLDYIKENDVPYSKLYDEGYRSVGCEPCTRAVKPGDGVRAGRWWWEPTEKKECGLHIKDGKIIRG